ncbi:MAG TPA: hypothetical protein VLA32_00525 [Anaerolineales bacterium]|jgi:hypothetical protein|nr:hypothetical protein [Anaerolineales bacterium]
MSDGWKTCFGFSFLILGLVLALLSVLAGGLGQLVESLGGNAWGIDLGLGVKIAAGVFVILFVAAIAFFVSIRNWAWFPAIAGGVYAVLPDLILGPEDDALAILAGVLASGVLTRLKSRREKKMDQARLESPPSDPGKTE